MTTDISFLLAFIYDALSILSSSRQWFNACVWIIIREVRLWSALPQILMQNIGVSHEKKAASKGKGFWQ